MSNPTITLRFADGTQAAVRAPALTVAYAVLENDDRKLVIGVVKKLPTESDGWASLERAERDYPTVHWVTLPSIDTGCPTIGAAKGYDTVTLVLDKNGDVEVISTDESPWGQLVETYGMGVVGDPVQTPGVERLPVVAMTVPKGSEAA